MIIFKNYYCVRICFSQLNYAQLTLCKTLMFLIYADDHELNPGPKKSNSCNNFSVCFLNLNSIVAHDFSKV